MDFTDKATKTEEKQQIDSDIAANDNIEIDGCASGGGGDGSVVVSRQSKENGNEAMNLLKNIEISNDGENSSLESEVKLPDSSTPKKLSGSKINFKCPFGRKICVDLIKTAINNGIGIQFTDDLKPFCRGINAKEIIEAPGKPLYKSQINKDERILTSNLTLDKSLSPNLADSYMIRETSIDSCKTDYVEPFEPIKYLNGNTSDLESEIPTKCLNSNVPANLLDLGNEIHAVKLPNFLSAESKPFNRDTYVDENGNADVLDEEGRQRIKLNVNNTMRWREVTNENGEKVIESNTRFVKWSDGSTTLHIGSEIFNAYCHNIQNDHYHLYTVQGSVLQGHGTFKSKLTFKPTSTESYTHKKMTSSAASCCQKKCGTKFLPNLPQSPMQNYAFVKNKKQNFPNNVKLSNSENQINSENDEQVAGPSGINNQRDDSNDDELYVIKNSNDKKKNKKGKNRKGSQKKCPTPSKENKI